MCERIPYLILTVKQLSSESPRKPSPSGAEPNRQASCPAGRQARRRTKSPNRHAAEPSRRTDTSPNRHVAEPNRRAVGRTAGHVAEPNRQASCQAGRRARRRTEMSRKPSSPNRIVKRAVRQGAGHAAEPSRRTDTPPNRVAEPTRRRTEPSSEPSPRNHERSVAQTIAQVDGRAEYRTAPIRLFRCESLNGGRY